MRILIVEDDAVISRYLKLILAKYGECEVAEDGEEAIECFKQALYSKVPFEVIFLDIMMPRIDGHRALKEIRDLEESFGVIGYEKAKIIMTSAIKDSETIKSTFQNHADGYLVKPILKNKIVKELSRLELIDE